MVEFYIITSDNPYFRDVPTSGMLFSRQKPRELLQHLKIRSFDNPLLLWDKALKWQENKGLEGMFEIKL